MKTRIVGPSKLTTCPNGHANCLLARCHVSPDCQCGTAEVHQLNYAAGTCRATAPGVPFLDTKTLMTDPQYAPPPKPEPTLAPPLERWAAIRTLDGETEYIDVSALTLTEESAWGIAEQRDRSNRKAIGRGEAFAHRRITRVRVEEVPS